MWKHLAKPKASLMCTREQIIEGLIIDLKERDLQQLLQWFEIRVRLHFFVINLMSILIETLSEQLSGLIS